MARIAHTAAAALVVGVVLRHRSAAAACACLTVDAAAAAAYCMTEGAAQIRPADGFLHSHCQNSRGSTKGFFLTCFFIIVATIFSQKTIFPTIVYYHYSV